MRVSARLIAGLALLVACLLPDSAHAIITGFLPGDACFGSDLSGATISQFSNGEPVLFRYRPGAGVWAGCGYAGYWSLEVHDMPGPMQQGLARVYEDQREFDRATYEITLGKEGTEHRSETNPFLVLIYNRDYDDRRGIGLKLNENWMNLVDYDGGNHHPGAYWPYIDGSEAIARDWELSPQIPGLKINETEAKPLWGPRIDKPLTINATDVQILVLPDGLHESYAMATDRSLKERILEQKVYPRHFYRVTSDGVTQCHWNDHGDFVEQSWPVDEVARTRTDSVDEMLESIDRAVTETYGIDESELPEDVTRRLEEFRENAEGMLDRLRDYRKQIAPQTPPTSTQDD